MELRLVERLDTNLLSHQFNRFQRRFLWIGRARALLEHLIEVQRCRLDLLASIKLLAPAPWLLLFLSFEVTPKQVELLPRLIEVLIGGTHLINVN